MIDHGELAEGTIAIGFGCIRPVSSSRKASLVWAGDDRVQIGIHNRVAVQHFDDRLTGTRVTYRV
ncbi:MAG TPA: hypothetical protein VFT30_10280, partial [Nitrospira sp.]|nr:hypothetical protein [Nitrospira sp.]